MSISQFLLEMNRKGGVKMKNKSIVIFISEMNIEMEMKHHNELEMKTSHGNEHIHHTEMN